MNQLPTLLLTSDTSDTASGSAAMGFLWLALCLFIYFLPAWIAHNRRHHNAAAIAAVNLFLGWTFLGWVIALAWALTRPAGQVAPQPVFPKPTMKHTLAALGIVVGLFALLFIVAVFCAVNGDHGSQPHAVEQVASASNGMPLPDAVSPSATPQNQDEYNEADGAEREQVRRALMSKLHNPDRLLLDKVTKFSKGSVKRHDVLFSYAQYRLLNKRGDYVKETAFVFNDRGRYFVVPADDNFGGWCDKVGFKPQIHYGSGA